MEIYRCHYQQPTVEPVENVVPETSKSVQKGTGQQPAEYWTTFEKAIEAVRQKKNKRRSGRK